jgi:hypothetical protein
MTDRLVDCRPAPRDSGTTSASFHPELLVGEFVVRPRIHVALMPKDHAIVTKRSRRISGAAMVVLAALGTWQTFTPRFDGGVTANAAERSNDPTCVSWDTTAHDAIATYIRSSGQDIDMKRINRMIAQMRRARQHCQLGRAHLACDDYRAIVGGLAGAIGTMPVAATGCGPAMASSPNATADVAVRH